MNHHVRNSLQVISYAASVPQQEAIESHVRNAVERIECALREVLPGQRQDIENLLFDARVSAEKAKTVCTYCMPGVAALQPARFALGLSAYLSDDTRPAFFLLQSAFHCSD